MKFLIPFSLGSSEIEVIDIPQNGKDPEDMNIHLTQTQVVIEKTTQIETKDSKPNVDLFAEAKKLADQNGNKNSNTSSMIFGGMSLKDCHVSFHFNSK